MADTWKRSNGWEMEQVRVWGTWEELVLGGAVLRHGVADWVIVASELQARTAYPHLFTPQECEAKYDDLQERYSGCKIWFEELRNQRVAELKKELEKSEDSIESLQSKLENLTSGRESDDANVDDYFCKESSGDGLSATSFTRRIDRERTPECTVVASNSSQNDGIKMTFLDNFRADILCADFGCGNFRKKRGPRKRKPTFKEICAGETESSFAAPIGDQSSQVSMQSSEKLRDETIADLSGIMDSISKHKCGSILQYKIEKQKKARYKKLIRLHVDLETINSGIKSGSISSAKELFRELLVLSNNALVFHSKNSPEHNSALDFRSVVMNHLRCRLHLEPLQEAKKLCGSGEGKKRVGRPRKGGKRVCIRQTRGR